MQRQAYIFAIAALAIVSGMFSPLASITTDMLTGLVRGPIAPTAGIFLAVNLIVTAMLTVMIGGVPAAIRERLTGGTETDTTGWWLWVAGTAAAALPGIARAVAVVLG